MYPKAFAKLWGLVAPLALVIVCIPACQQGQEPTKPELGKVVERNRQLDLVLQLASPDQLDSNSNQLLRVTVLNNSPSHIAFSNHGLVLHVVYYDSSDREVPKMSTFSLPEYSDPSIADLVILGPGDTYSLSVSANINPSAKPGSYTVRVVLRPQQQWPKQLVQMLRKERVKIWDGPEARSEGSAIRITAG